MCYSEKSIIVDKKSFLLLIIIIIIIIIIMLSSTHFHSFLLQCVPLFEKELKAEDMYGRMRTFNDQLADLDQQLKKEKKNSAQSKRLFGIMEVCYNNF